MNHTSLLSISQCASWMHAVIITEPHSNEVMQLTINIVSALQCTEPQPVLQYKLIESSVSRLST